MSCIVTRAAFINSATLSGNIVICPGGNGVYTISGLGAGNTVTWSSSNTAVATVSGGTQSQVTVNGLTNGAVNLIATVTNACGQVATPITKAINIGAPFPLNGIDAKPIWIRASFYNVDLTFNPILGTTSYYWTIEKDLSSDSFACGANKTDTKFSNNLTTLTTTTPTATLKIGSCTSNYVVTCTATNLCGSNVIYERYVTIGASGTSPCNTNTTISKKIQIQNPIKNGVLVLKNINNPILVEDDEVIISNILPGDDPCEGPYLYDKSTLKKKNASSGPNQFKIEIYNLMGQNVFSNTFHTIDQEYNLKDINLKSGKYIVHINDGVTTQKEIIIIE